MTGGTILLQSNNGEHMARSVVVPTETQHQVPVATGWSSKQILPLPPTVANENDVLDIAVPAALVEISEYSRTAFSTLSDVMKAVCSIYDKGFKQLTESYEMEAGDSLFGIVDLLLSEPSYNVRRKAERAISEHNLFPRKYIRDLASCARKLLRLWGPMPPILCLATDRCMVSEAA